MDLDETMVEEELDNAEVDDTLPEGVTEEADESEESLESITEDIEQPAEEAPKEEPPSASEPGWIKKRVEKAVSKAVAQTRAEMQAMFDQQMAPIREKLLNDEARELVRQGEFKSLERAKEYLQLKQGQPVTVPSESSTQQPRQANGQFAPKQDAGVTARIEMLQHQADKIKANKGPDVIAEFQNNQEIKQKVIAGEMDFYDVADYLRQNQKSSRRKPPSPMRSPNGASGNNNPNAIDSMSDEQFERMEKRISEGARFRLN